MQRGFNLFSRKDQAGQAEDTASSKENGRPTTTESGFKSLRSRLQVYAKKLDSRERDSPPPLFAQPGSVAQTLSPPPATPIATRHLQLKLKLSSSSPALHTPRRDQTRSKSANTSPTTRHSPAPAQPPDMRPSASRSRALGTKSSSSSLAATPTRKPTDTVTTTLAQRLNELAIANSEGLLNDDEYRLLRQDLFQRFSSTTVVPTETPIVPLASSRSAARIGAPTAPADKRQSIDSRRISISTSSNFVVEKQRTPSMHSRSSMTSGVASFFRRATGRSSSHDFSDSSSIYSATSAAPSESTNRFKRLSTKNSNSSLGTDRGDTVSISSRRTNNVSSPTESGLPGGSIRSVRRLPTPPSSFPTRLPGVESRYAGMAPEPDGAGADAENPDSVQAIRREMLSVEAEGRRLMDAFSGLELSTLTKRRRIAATSPRDSVATLVPDVRVIRRTRKGSDATDGDCASLRSATSAGTAASGTSRRSRPALKPGGPVQMQSPGLLTSASSPRVGSLHRKNSVSSVGSSTSRLGISGNGSGSGGGGLVVPPVPPLPLGMSLGQMGSAPSLTRSTGHLPMGVVREDEAVLTVDLDDEREFGLEMEELRRRREEVAARYEARLEYLRAKLKGAELHAKLLK